MVSTESEENEPSIISDSADRAVRKKLDVACVDIYDICQSAIVFSYVRYAGCDEFWLYIGHIIPNISNLLQTTVWSCLYHVMCVYQLQTCKSVFDITTSITILSSLALPAASSCTHWNCIRTIHDAPLVAFQSLSW